MRSRHLALWALLFCLLPGAVYLGARHTDAYTRAARFVHRDARVAALIGTVNKVDFRFWHGFTYTRHRAGFSFVARSGKGAFIVDVHLRHRPGSWRVQDADIHSRDGSDTHIMLH